MAEENQRFSIGFEVSNPYHTFYGSAEFIVKDNVILAVEEKVDVDLENSEEGLTQYKYVREITHSLGDMGAEENDSEYRKLYRWVDNHSQMILEDMGSGDDFVDYGKYCLKVYDVRPLLEVELSLENCQRIDATTKMDMSNKEFIEAMMEKLIIRRDFHISEGFYPDEDDAYLIDRCDKLLKGLAVL